jgi:hypothetical protein
VLSQDIREEKELSVNATKNEQELLLKNKEILEEMLKTSKEAGGFYSSSTGEFSDIKIGDKHNTQTSIKEWEQASSKYDTRVHKHNYDVAAPSFSSKNNDFQTWIKGFDYIKKQIIVAKKEILSFDFSSLDVGDLEKIAEEYTNAAKKISDEFDKYISDGKVPEMFGSLDNLDEQMQIRLRQSLENIMKNYTGVMTSYRMPDMFKSKDNRGDQSNISIKDKRSAELVAEMESVGNVDDKTSVKELDIKQAKLEEILQLLKNESLLTKEIQDRYNEINKIISDRRINHLFHSTKSQNANAGSGTGDASRSELEAARNEADRLRNENQSLREDLNDEIHRSNQAEGDRAVAENKLAEAEEKNTKLQQAHAEERKALDNIIASKNDEITRLQAEKEYAVRETDSAYDIAYEERSRADEAEARANEAEARANKLQEQLDKISAGRTPDGSKKQNGISINKEELKDVLERAKYQVKIDTKDEPWAREETLNGTIKGILEGIRDNKLIGNSNDVKPVNVNLSTIENKLQDILNAVKNIKSGSDSNDTGYNPRNTESKKEDETSKDEDVEKRTKKFKELIAITKEYNKMSVKAAKASD